MFDNKKKQFEKKSELDLEKKFKIAAKRNKLLAKWAANQMNLELNLIDSYINEVIDSDFEKPGYDDVIKKIHNDFEKKHINVDITTIENKLLEFEKSLLDDTD